MSEKFSSEKLYQEHDSAAWQLKHDKKEEEALDESNFVSKLIAAISGKRAEIEKAVQQSEKTYEENLRLAQEHIDEMHEEANEYVRTYDEVYKSERERLIQEQGAQYAKRVEDVPWPGSPVDINSYIDELRNLRVGAGVSLEDKARMVAAIDIFKPKMDNPGWAGMTFRIGERGVEGNEVGIHNGTRFPRWELGKDDMKSAAEVAKGKSWKHILEVSTTVTYPKRYDSAEKSDIQAQKNVYIPVGEETAKLLARVGAENLNSSSTLTSDFGRGLDLSTLDERFSVVELDPVEGRT